MFSAPIIVNDNIDPEIAGDVSIFATVEDAELYLEPWFADEPHSACDIHGIALQLHVWIDEKGHERLQITEKPNAPECAEKARYFLKSALESYLGPKGERNGLTKRHLENAELSDMVRYIAEQKLYTR